MSQRGALDSYTVAHMIMGINYHYNGIIQKIHTRYGVALGLFFSTMYTYYGYSMPYK